MGRVKELWMDKLEEIGRLYAEGRLTYQEAMYQLMQLGLDPHDASDHLAHAERSPL